MKDHPGDRDMRGHHGIHTRLDGPPERNELETVQPEAVRFDYRQLDVRIRAGIPVSRKVLAGRHQPTRVHAPDHRGPERRDSLRVLSEGSRVDDGVGGVAVDVQYGRKIEVETKISQKFADLVARIACVIDGNGAGNSVDEGGGTGPAQFIGVMYRNSSGELTGVNNSGAPVPRSVLHWLEYYCRKQAQLVVYLRGETLADDGSALNRLLAYVGYIDELPEDYFGTLPAIGDGAESVELSLLVTEDGAFSNFDSLGSYSAYSPARPGG